MAANTDSLPDESTVGGGYRRRSVPAVPETSAERDSKQNLLSKWRMKNKWSLEQRYFVLDLRTNGMRWRWILDQLFEALW